MPQQDESWVKQHVLPEDEATWQQLSSLALRDVMGLRLAFARVRRSFHEPDRALDLNERMADAPHGARPHWTRGDVIRLALIRVGYRELAPEPRVSLVRRLLQTGDLTEQESLLRTLAGLHEPEHYVELAVDACRTNTTRAFAALAIRNGYPAAYFSEPAFNQMVLKALFMGVPVREVEGLAARINPELERMVAAYASERRAAGRSVPSDVDWILGLTPRGER